MKAARILIPLAIFAVLAPACGLSTSGLEGTGDDASVTPDSGSSGDEFIILPGDSSSSGADTTAPLGDSGHKDTGAPTDSAVPKDAPADVVKTDSTTPCLGTPASCGLPGACVSCASSPSGDQCIGTACGCKNNPDCATSPQGTACVSGQCGCNDPNRDCPAGNACSSGHLCTASCAGGLTCNDGCCDGNACQPGKGNGVCGNSGGPCAPCSGQNPTCSAAGQCNAQCGGAGDGACGTGFCCSGGMCADDTKGGSCGATCTDCAGSPQGAACLGGSCGCNGNGDCNGSSVGHLCFTLTNHQCGCLGPMDCPMGQACTGGACGTSCGALSTCNGGCCNGGTCVASCPMPHMCNGGGQCM